MNPRLIPMLATLLAGAASGPLLPAQSQNGLTTFSMDHRGAMAVHPPVDVSYLLDAPAGKHGFVVVKDGHLATEDGQRIRFWGVNITDWSKGSRQVPSKEDAPFIAATLARFGVNSVRFQFLDLEAPRGLYTDDPAVAIVEINNENAINVGFRAPSAFYEDELTGIYNQWLAKHRDRAQLAALRQICEVVAGAAVPLIGRRGQAAQAPPERFYAEAELYNDLQRDYFLDMEKYIKQTVGSKSLIIASADHSHSSSGYPILLATTSMDIPPTLIEQVKGTITLRGIKGARSLQLQPIDGAGQPLGAPVAATAGGNEWKIALGATTTTWYQITVTR